MKHDSGRVVTDAVVDAWPSRSSSSCHCRTLTFTLSTTTS